MRPGLALALALLCAGPPLPARAEAPAADAVDALPRGPSPQQRLAEIRQRVQAAVVYPPRARELGVEGTARIQFVIGEDGLAREVETVESSGHGMLDRAAEAGARAAGRLPPLYGRIQIPIRFDLRGRSR
jgi:TonB family protein